MRRIFEQRASEIIHFGWEHGRFFDYWSFIHFLTGTLLGIIAVNIGIAPWTTLLCVAGIATLYEVLEIMLHVSEDAENVLFDIILTTAGAVFIQYSIDMTTSINIIWIFIGIGLIDLFLLSLGWRHYLKKKLHDAQK
ncbi:hypothetical protein MNBD_CPR01-385 [hydrothermal vent metagenome]|uniref:Uncharacterized protein n=1 Tax=hydrothermal vent metagenome TaxID=652676 RepID=A0A3B0VLF7_9ZZZZ